MCIRRFWLKISSGIKSRSSDLNFWDTCISLSVTHTDNCMLGKTVVDSYRPAYSTEVCISQGGSSPKNQYPLSSYVIKDAMWILLSVHKKTDSINSGVLPCKVNSLMLVVATTETFRNMDWLCENFRIIVCCILLEIWRQITGSLKCLGNWWRQHSRPLSG